LVAQFEAWSACCRHDHAIAGQLSIIGMDAVFFAVRNAKQAAHHYSTAFGMRRTAVPDSHTSPSSVPRGAGRRHERSLATRRTHARTALRSPSSRRYATTPNAVIAQPAAGTARAKASSL